MGQAVNTCNLGWMDNQVEVLEKRRKRYERKGGRSTYSVRSGEAAVGSDYIISRRLMGDFLLQSTSSASSCLLVL